MALQEGNLTEGSITGTMIRFALPLMLGNLLQQCYNIADTIIVGRVLGAGALAAVGSSYALIVFITSVFIGLCLVGLGGGFCRCSLVDVGFCIACRNGNHRCRGGVSAYRRELLCGYRLPVSAVWLLSCRGPSFHVGGADGCFFGYTGGIGLSVGFDAFGGVYRHLVVRSCRLGVG